MPSQPFKKMIVSAIDLYQRTLSPDHGAFKARHPFGYCRYYPSCSEYTKQKVLTRGAVMGIGLGILRILRCNPFSQGGVDLP